jgi:hypothetical protein
MAEAYQEEFTLVHLVMAYEQLSYAATPLATEHAAYAEFRE